MSIFKTEFLLAKLYCKKEYCVSFVYSQVSITVKAKNPTFVSDVNSQTLNT